MPKINPLNKNQKLGIYSKIPIEILQEILIDLGYKDIADSKAETLVVHHLGPKVEKWHDIIQRKLKNEQLGQKVFRCLLPKLPSQFRFDVLPGNMIIDACQIYENAYDFTIFGPFSANDQFTVEIFNAKNRISSRYAFLINTSRLPLNSHLDGGSHWVLLYIDLRQIIEGDNGQFEYFDSLGMLPNLMVKSTISSIVRIFQVIADFHISSEILYSQHQLQHGPTECGVYCMWFLFKRLLGMQFSEFFNVIFTDDQCQKLRDFFWDS